MPDTPKRSFPPVVDANTRVLVLGSLPGDASLAAQAYYAHPRNAFWPIMANLCADAELATRPYPERLGVLLTHGVGLWDVVGAARRRGSLDAALREVEHNDLPGLLAGLPAVRAVACNGATAYRLACRQLPASVPCLSLPSTSPAYTLAFPRKLAAWQVLQPWLTGIGGSR